jgi:hypothetical protein
MAERIDFPQLHAHLAGMKTTDTPRDRMKRRLDRQFLAIERLGRPLVWFVPALRNPWVAVIRIPLGILFVAGGFLAILPIFGLWMIPLGLLLLAVDVPLLRPVVTSGIIRTRRRAEIWRRRWRRRG